MDERNLARRSSHLRIRCGSCRLSGHRVPLVAALASVAFLALGMSAWPASADTEDAAAESVVRTADNTTDEERPPTASENTDAAVPEPVVEEVVVYGRRRDAEMSIEAKRQEDRIVDVLSADQASRLPDNNVAESLGRIPGVSFRRSGETGNGNFISVRGLDSALSSVSFDGVKSGLSSGGRRVPLDGITTDDLAELRVVKSLLPQDAGEGIGGAVDLVSRKPLDYRDNGASATFESRYGEFADRWGYRGRLSFNRLGEDFAYRVSVSARQRRIRNFELDSTSSNLTYLPPLVDAAGNAVDNDLVLDELDDPGSSFDNVTPGFFPLDAITFEEYTYEVQDQQRDTLSLSGAFEWQLTPTTRLLLSARVNRQEALAVENSIAFDNDDDDFDEIDGVLYTIFDDPEVDLESQIEDEETLNASVYLSASTELERTTLSYRVSYSTAARDAPETDIDFDTGSLLDADDVVFVPVSFVGRYFPVPNAGAATDPDFVDAIMDPPGTQILDDFSMTPKNARDNDRIGVKFDAEHQLGLAFAGGHIVAVRAGAELGRSDIADDDVTLVSFEADALNLDGSFSPEFEGTGEGEELERFEGLFGGFVSLEPVGSPLTPIGLRGIPVLNEKTFRRLAATFEESFAALGGEPFETFFFEARETLLAGYVQAEFEAGPLSVIGGVRVEGYRGSFSSPLVLDARLITVNLEDPGDEDTAVAERIDLGLRDAGDIIRSDAANTELLPRFNLLYQLGDGLQFRLGAGYSIARPTFYQLGYATSIDFVLLAEADEEGDTPVLPGVTTAAEAVAAGLDIDQLTEIGIFVSSGNPSLDNARSLNLDASIEYYPMPGTAITLGLFHKKIDNFIFVGAEPVAGGLDLDLIRNLLSPDGRALVEQLGGLDAVLRSDAIGDLDIRQPRNGGTAEVSGFEFAIQHQFGWARGWLSRMGFSANVAYTDSEAEIAVVEAATTSSPDGGLEDDEALVVLGFAAEGDGLYRRTDFFNAPTWSANVTLFYESDRLEVALSAQHQGSSFDSVDDFGFDQYSARYTQWDFYIEYDLERDIWLADTSVYLEIPDITDSGRNPTDLQTLGRERRVFDEASFNGREFRMGIRASF